MDQWVRTVPVDSESPDTELAPEKFNIIPGLRPPGIACSNHFSRFCKRTSRRLYLHKKTLLC
jgi:hypothetical protein